MKKQILSAALALSLCAGLVPGAAFADNAAPLAPPPEALAAPVQPLAAGDVSINDASIFPDPAFRQMLADPEWCPAGRDGVLTAEELATTKEMYTYPATKDLTGIQLFTGLEMLACHYNGMGYNRGCLTSIDVSKNTKLKTLSISNQDIRSIDLRHNPDLTSLEANGTLVTEVDFSSTPKLSNLRLEHTPLNKLDVTGLPLLKSLNCEYTNLSALDISHNPNLTSVNATNTQLSELNITNNPNLTSISIENTQIKDLDLSGLNDLYTIMVSGTKVPALDLSRFNRLRTVSCANTSIDTLDLSHCSGLFNVDISNTPIQELDLSTCRSLFSVNVSNSQLSSLNLPVRPRTFLSDGCSYTVNSDTVDLTTLPGQFEMRRASNFQGGTVDGNILTFTAPEVTYTYMVAPGLNATFKLVRGEVPDVPAVENKIERKGNSLSLDGEIYINHYVTITGFEGVDIAQNGGLLIWKTPVTDETATFETAETVKPGLTKSEYGYGQQTDGIAAKEYADTLYFRAYLKDNAGVYHYGPLSKYGVRSYAENMIRKDRPIKQLCIEMLHYGAAAQLYFDYNTGDLANKNIAAQYPAAQWDPAALTPLASAETDIVPTGDVKLHGNTLSLDGAISMNHYYYNPAFAVQKAELLVWNRVPGPLTEATAARVPMIFDGKDYAAASVEVPSSNYGETVFVCARFEDTDGNVHYSTVSGYSPERYAASKIKQNKNPLLVETVKKMVMYGEEAQRYFAQ